MYKPLALFIGLRYTRTRKKNYLVSFVSLVSMLGITLGVLALIAVLSVINGSTSTMREETLKTVPHASIRIDATDRSWQEIASSLGQQAGIVGVAPFIEGEAWLGFEGQADFVQIRGVEPLFEAQVASSGPAMDVLLPQLQDGASGIILGTQLAARLGLYNGDQLSVTPLNSLVNRRLEDARTFQVIGIADFGFYGNNNTALVHLAEASILFGSERTRISPAHALQLRLRVNDVLRADSITRTAVSNVFANQLPDTAISTWQQTQASLFDALRLEKALTGFMLLMIVIIGAVNIVSTLVMVVADKSADIAILRTMGAGRGSIMAIFVTQGAAVGIFGTLLGVLLGVLLALNIDGFTRWLENILNSGMFNDNVYMISHLRAELQFSDVVVISICAIVVSLLATLYPAYRASRIQPAEVLRYE